MSDARASSEGRVDDVPTPFYDLLTAMIEAHALENERVRQYDDAVRARKGDANRGWEVLAQHMNACIPGLIMSAAMGGAIFLLQVNLRQPPVVAAVDEPSKGRSPLIGAAGTTNEPVLQAADVVAAHSDDRTVAPPVTAQPIEQSSSEVTPPNTFAPAASEPSKESSPEAPPSQPLAGKTGSTIGQTNDAVAIRLGRAISHVNMRAGPSNDQAVVMRIPEGSPVEVVKCRHWCEVIFAGQQGWVYKGFISISPVPPRL